MQVAISNRRDAEPSLPTGAWNQQPVAFAQVAGLLVLYFGLWLFTTPYAGLSHDAQAYAFQALARMDPDGLGKDIFLRFGSQDRYSIFPGLYALAAHRFGVEATAAALTLALQFCWLTAAFLVLRLLAGSRMALLSLGLLITIPGAYGGLRVFHIAEPFLTARLPAEVLSLLAIWAYLGSRRLVCAALLAAGLLLHPLMSFPALLFLVFLWVDSARPSGVNVPLATIGIVVALIAGALLAGGDRAVVNHEWLRILRLRSEHLFLDRWTPADWNNTVLTLLTLLLASLMIVPGQVKRAAACAMWLGLAGLLLTEISSEIWHLKILMQGQPWRWLWISRFFAITLMPVAIYCAWVSGRSARTSAVMLAAAWLVVVPVSSGLMLLEMIGSILALLSLVAWLARNRLPETTRILAERCAGAVLLVVLIGSAAKASLAALLSTLDPSVPANVQQLLGAMNTITPAVLIVVVAWVVLARFPGRLSQILVGIAGLSLVAFAAPMAKEKWTRREFSGPVHELFADWRAIIPQSNEVFWWDSLREVWFLLERRSYLTLSQGGGAVFSPEMTIELQRRAHFTRSFIDPGYWFNEPTALNAHPRPLTRTIMTEMCEDPALGNVVSVVDLQTGAHRKEWPYRGEYIYLYDCRDFRVKHGA